MKKEYLQIAIRNIFLYKSRTLLTGLCILIGTQSIIVGLAFTEGIIRQTVIGFTGTLIEDVMIYPYNEADITKHAFKGAVLKQYDKIQESLYQLEGIDYVTKKLQFGGVIFSEKSQLNAVFMGMEPEGIRRKDNLQMIKGEYLEETDDKVLILSKKIAKRLKVDVGDLVAITVNMPNGGTNAEDFMVKGIFDVKTGLQFVDFLIYITLNDTQDLMGMKRDQVFSLGIYLNDVETVDDYIRIISKKLKDESLPGIAISWKDTMEGLLNSYNFVKYVVLIFTIILVLIVTTGVVNAVYMSISERTREIGTMMALGAKRKVIVFLFFMETGILSVVFSALGCLLAVTIVFYVKSLKIDVQSRALVWMFGGKTVVPYLDVSIVLFSFLFVISVTMIGIFFPIFKASKMNPTEALRHV